MPLAAWAEKRERRWRVLWTVVYLSLALGAQRYTQVVASGFDSNIHWIMIAGGVIATIGTWMRTWRPYVELAGIACIITTIGLYLWAFLAGYGDTPSAMRAGLEGSVLILWTLPLILAGIAWDRMTFPKIHRKPDERSDTKS